MRWQSDDSNIVKSRSQVIVTRVSGESGRKEIRLFCLSESNRDRGSETRGRCVDSPRHRNAFPVLSKSYSFVVRAGTVLVRILFEKTLQECSGCPDYTWLHLEDHLWDDDTYVHIHRVDSSVEHAWQFDCRSVRLRIVVIVRSNSLVQWNANPTKHGIKS